MAQYRPWQDKSYLYEKYVTKRMTIDAIAAECTENGTPVTPMTIYNNLIKHSIPIRGGNRRLGQRTVGKKRGRGGGGFYS